MNYIRLLEEWENKNLKEMTKNFNEEIDNIKKKDVALLEVETVKEKFINMLDKIIEKYNLEIDFNIQIPLEKYITTKSKEAIEELRKEYTNKKQDILNIRREVEAAISICENEESLRKVLIAYNIIDKNGKIKVQ